jgi:hypothetical protein
MTQKGLSRFSNNFFHPKIFSKMVDAIIDFPRGGELAPAAVITRADIKRHRKKEAKIEKV